MKKKTFLTVSCYENFTGLDTDHGDFSNFS